MARVAELQPGDVIGGGIFIQRADHPVHQGLCLCIWILSDGTLTLDALSPRQEVGEVTEHIENVNKLITGMVWKATREKEREKDYVFSTSRSGTGGRHASRPATTGVDDQPALPERPDHPSGAGSPPGDSAAPEDPDQPSGLVG